MNNIKLSTELSSRVKTFLKLLLVGLLIGAATGIVGTVFSLCIQYVVSLREQYPLVLYCLPIGGVVIAWMYTRYAKSGNVHGTDLVIESIQQEQALPKRIVPLIFSSTIITQFLGGSAGREGAALQLGGGIGSWIGSLLKCNKNEVHLFVMCGMAGCFAAVFQTPITATVLAMEVATVGVLYYSAIVPCSISCFVAYVISHTFIASEVYIVSGIPEVSVLKALQVIVLATACALIAIGFCKATHLTSSLFSKWMPNLYIKAIVGGIAIILLTFVFGDSYRSAGTNLIELAIHEGQVNPFSFLIKILFTAVTLSAGYKGGEIVPAFSVGALFGCVVGPLLGLDPSFSAAIGFLCLFCGVTNCPLATFVLSVELFPGGGAIYYMIAAAISYLMSGYVSIYSNQVFVHDKSRHHPHDEGK